MIGTSAHFTPVLAQLAYYATEDRAALGGIAVVLGFVCVGLLIGLGIAALICWYLSGILKAIPAEHRKQEPAMVWLLMIPLVNIVWNFFVYPKISESFQSYFNAQGRTDVGDCGKSLSMTFCILACTSVIPYLGACTGLAALVIWIIVLVKFSGLKSQLRAPTA